MCCGADPNKPIGVMSDKTTLKDLWNSEQMKTNRLLMLEDKPVPECTRCYEIEENGGRSLRVDHNMTFEHHMDILEETNPDGSLDRLNMPYVDFRFSNFCNLRCRTCGPDLSSKWAADHAKLNPSTAAKYEKVIKPEINPTIFWDQIDEIFPTIERIYFAGGEPLIMEEHYRLLDMLIENGRTEVVLLYNTNFTSLKYKDKKIVDYWKQFGNVTVCASLDSWGSRAEYMRKDLRWDIVEQNFREVQEHCPHVRLDIGLTLSIFNFATLVEYYDYMVDNKFIHADGLNINILTNPIWYKPSCIPIEYRLEIAEKYKQKLNWLIENKRCGKIMLDRWRFAINYITTEEEPQNKKTFVELTQRMDSMRGESFVDTFPELRFMFGE
jgi:MoaA/NifB/PqqE/SkfB family radical SAM enzyme